MSSVRGPLAMSRVRPRSRSIRPCGRASCGGDRIGFSLDYLVEKARLRREFDRRGLI